LQLESQFLPTVPDEKDEGLKGELLMGRQGARFVDMRALGLLLAVGSLALAGEKAPTQRWEAGNTAEAAGVKVTFSKPVVDRRSRYGDWEGDTIVGANRRGGAATLVELRFRHDSGPTRKDSPSGGCLIQQTTLR
jgi:hypothetical protein